MAKPPKQPEKQVDEQEEEFQPPPKPAIPSRDGRSHRATFSRDKYEGGYNVKVVGPAAKRMEGRWVPVTKKDDSEEMRYLLRLVFGGTDDDTGQPMAIYKCWAEPRKDADAIPF